MAFEVREPMHERIIGMSRKIKRLGDIIDGKKMII
jgi:hypothetical protein